MLLLGFIGHISVSEGSPISGDGTVIRVSPENGSAIIGSNFTIKVEILNVKDLYGLDVQLSWDSSKLHCVDHEKTIPVESHEGGVLHGPTVSVKDDVDESAKMDGSEAGAMYWLVEASALPAVPFTGNGSFFTMTFQVLRAEACDIHIVAAVLARLKGIRIECRLSDGHFLGTRLEHDVSVQLGIPRKAWVNGSTCLNATLLNYGLSDESVIGLKLFVENVMIKETIVESLAVNGSYVMTGKWIPTVAGDYEVEVRATPVSGENKTWDNTAIRKLHAVVDIPDISILVEMPLFAVVGIVADLRVQVSNIGEDTSNAYVQLAFNSSIFDLIETGYLSAGSMFAFNYSWMPSSVGRWNITVTTLRAPNEVNTENNGMTRLIRAIEMSHQETCVFMIFPENEIKVGDLFTVSVNIVNAKELFGMDVQLSWDPTFVQYVCHEKMTPVEQHLDGVLHAPILPVFNDVDENAQMPGAAPETRYWLSECSQLPAAPFNGLGTFVVLTFRALRHGDPHFVITSLCLADTGGSPLPASVEYGTMAILARGEGDVNDNGIVDILDLVQAARCYRSVEGQPDWNQFADVAAPWKIIDILDLVTISSHYGNRY